jgi:hypothetical protein
MTHHRLVDLMTKDEIIHVVRRSGCKMMVGLAYHTMTKEDLIRHLQRSCCPTLKQLCEKK